MCWYQWICWLLSASGVLCILVGHEHYSVDVLVGYFVTTRLFWWYHTMANTHVSTLPPQSRPRLVLNPRPPASGPTMCFLTSRKRRIDIWENDQIVLRGSRVRTIRANPSKSDGRCDTL